MAVATTGADEPETGTIRAEAAQAAAGVAEEADAIAVQKVIAVPALTVEQLRWLLEGIDIGVVQRHPPAVVRARGLKAAPLYGLVARDRQCYRPM